jgi:hypothetical protein
MIAKTMIARAAAITSISCLFIWPTVAAAVDSKPLTIKRFTMQTTTASRLIKYPGSPEGYLALENVPYEFTQAGGHPWGLTTTYEFSTEEVEQERGVYATVPTQDPKDIVTTLPPGLLGNPNPEVFPRCPLTEALAGAGVRCPTDTQIGVVRLRFFGGAKESLAPIVNVTPEKGQSAEFALETSANLTYLLTAHVVRSDGAYRLTVVSNEIPLSELDEAELTFWGVPADPSHDPLRGISCSAIAGVGAAKGLTCTGGNKASSLPNFPFLTWPADCSAGPLDAIGRVDSWEEPGRVREGRYTGYREATVELPAVTGCNRLVFEPALEIKPDNLLADAPVGVGVTVKVPLVESPDAAAVPQVRNTVLTFPEGVSISPGIVDGIQACDESGPEGINFEGPESEEMALNGELQLAAGHCPAASTIGEAEAETPLLPDPVKGHVYLARPRCGGNGEAVCTPHDAADGDLYQLYLELGGTGDLSDAGVNLKVRMRVQANLATGQLTTITDETPQLPFSELRIRLNGGPRAGLDNPATCGPALTSADFTPWSAPGVTPQGLSMPGTPDSTPSAAFDVTGCLGLPPPFAPGFIAGTVTPNAGKFSSFTMDLARKDREQYLKGIQIYTPPGLTGLLASVPLCEEAQANAGTCPDGSKIGTTRVASGAGSHPFEIDGDVYLTTSYHGAPFGLSIATHALVGPFNLGNVVVRARVEVDPRTAALIVTTDETGPHALPQIIFGVPVRLQRVTVNIDRPHFMINPTNCTSHQVAASISGDQDAVSNISSPFAVGSCATMIFKPTFKVLTSAHTSRRKGANLDAKVSYPRDALGRYSNIARFKVSLPRQLPSRLTTLQHACSAETFEADPARCPRASIVGIARASTPLLPVGLVGPAYFVSHGGEAFPDLVVVLEGDGVRVDLIGTTFISKAGITSSTFKALPDVPVHTFELYLPEGRYSALAANGNLCKVASKLKMPTEMVGQNGAIIKQLTTITVSGCPSRPSGQAWHKRMRTSHIGRRSVRRAFGKGGEH